MLIVFILPAIAHVLAIVIFIQLLGTNKRLELLKNQIASLKKQVDELTRRAA